MKKYIIKNSIVAVIVFVVAFVWGLAEPIITFAATTPSLGVAATYGVLAGTYTNTVAGTTINGDIGYTTGPAMIPTVNGTTYGAGAPTPTARINAADALTNLNSQACTFTFASGAIDLATDTTHGSLGVYTPGVYCTTGAGAASIGTAGITLSGDGTYIFRINGALTSVDNSTVTLTNGASASDVFWTPIAATTLGANTTFKGTIIDNANAITIGASTAWIGRAISLGAGTVTTDTDTITVPTTLRVIKTVINDNGGTTVASGFNLHVKLSGVEVAGSPAVGLVSPGRSYALSAGTYVVSEDANTSYAQVFSGDCNSSGSVTLATGDSKICTITNDDIAPAPATLRVIKTVINDNGGMATTSAWTLTVTSSNGGTGTGSAVGAEAPGTAYTLQTGKAYSVAESGGPSGYSSSPSSDCTIASAVAGMVYTCTITNDDVAPALHLRKVVINDSGGTALNTAWTLTATGTGGSPTNLTGITPVDSGTTFKADTYTLAESAGPSGYTASAWVCVGGVQVGSAVTVALGESATCTITNNDITPGVATLNVIKHVVNDNGGMATTSAWTLTVTSLNGGTGTGSAVGAEAPGTAYTLQTGKAYSVAESGGPSGYSSSPSSDCTIASAVAGMAYTCTIINDDVAPQLVVNKVVVNDNGGTKIISDFPLFIDGGNVTSGVASTTTIGLHTVSETADSSYTTVIGGNCVADGTITLALGDVKTCTITNNDIAPVVPLPLGGGDGGGSYYVPVPPLIDVVKVPNPLALPGGSGPVTYTYTLRNIGTIPVANITMVGDTCSPIILISGDTNVNARLDMNETWKYTCSMTLSKTHTNIVTVTGWGWERESANSISATDIANATVIVGVPVVPPLIHVTKIPNPLVLSAGGGIVTYTNKVTNPGTVALSNVRLTDDKCGPVKYISGDTNGNSKLDTIETWTYTCQTKLAKTTVNTITASGEANGLTARDFAIVTVVVSAVPKLPNTGLPLSEDNIPWNVIVPAGIFAILTLFYFARRKQTA